MISRLVDIASVDTGYHVRGKVPLQSDGPFRIIQTKDISDIDHTLVVSGLSRIGAVASPERYLVRKGDVIFAPRGTRNFASPILDELNNVVAAGHFYILRLTTQTVLPEYLAWYMNQRQAQLALKSHARGSGIKMIPRHAVEELTVPVPRLELQCVISQISYLVALEHSLSLRLAEARRELTQALCLQAAKQ